MKKLTNCRYIAFLVVVVFAFNFVGCKPVDKKNTEGQTVKPLLKKAIEKEVKDVVYPLPTTFELTSMLNRIGADYILGLSNSSENADKYFTEKARALNLGVYSADLSYASTYQRKQETMLFLKASKALIDNLEITSAYNETLVEEVEKNLDDKDQLVKIITNSFYDTYEFLNKNAKGNLSLMVVSGSFIEGLYIATHISENTYSNPEIVKVIFDQKEVLEKLLSVLEPEAKDPNIDSLLIELNGLKLSYDKIVDGSMDEEQLKEITTSVAKLRDSIVQ
ncbi:hypothetical protein GQR60_12250 [Labilibaculum sp. A4]|uniref:hypothetical protein n=1 Tax=Labilibaculum euxinus TaxID=2686357 RepID=UPI000F625DBA|nr:hypothetical protein [Labilibaculum euxinus]MDQ1771324.1 hypothetical protein [Labilibaculum euxinus]MWN77112.1 hypothetical protein [Labilibaculum euxinus]